MSKAMIIGVSIELPEDQFEAAEHLVALKPAWAQFMTSLNSAGVKSTPLGTSGTQKQAAQTGAKRTRRTKAQMAAVAQGASPPDEDDAA